MTSSDTAPIIFSEELQPKLKEIDDMIRSNAEDKEKGKRKDYLFNLERWIKKCFWINNHFVREFLAELVGTLLLVTFGCGSVADYKLAASSDGNPIFLTVNLTFGIGLTLAILITAKISGGHINPAISFAAFLVGNIGFIQFIVYFIAQFIGAFCGAALVYVSYMDALKAQKDMYSLNYAGIFATYPKPNLTILGGVLDQAIGTFLLVVVFLSLIDKRNNTPEDGLHWTFGAIGMGLAVTVIGMSFGYNTGYAINPARDVAPRLFSMIIGWGTQTFTTGNYFFWIPLCVPFGASFIATLFYIVFINNNKPAKQSKQSK